VRFACINVIVYGEVVNNDMKGHGIKHMIRTKGKISTIMVMVLALLALAAFSSFKGDTDGPDDIWVADDFAGTTLGGVKAMMPESSVKVLFEGILGCRLGECRGYKSIEDTLFALHAGEIGTAWFSDVTVNYLLKTYDDLREVDVEDIIKEDRLKFGMALDASASGKELAYQIDMALGQLVENGKLDELIDKYVEYDMRPARLYEKDMAIKKGNYSFAGSTYGGAVKYVGITGMTAPIELVDMENNPYGFCIALMDEVAQIIGIDARFVYVRPEAAFSALKGGKVDLLFCHGTGYSTLDPDGVVVRRSYVMTDGYYGMNKYSFVCLDKQ